MALAMASTVSFRGYSQEVLEGSLHSSRLSTGKTARIAVARPAFRVRAQQQDSAETETSRRALLGFGAAGLVSGSFVQAVLSGGLQRGESMAMAAAAPKVVKVAALCGALSKTSTSRGLIRAAIELSQSIAGLEIEDVDITKLPFLNTDIIKPGQPLPKEVEEFKNKIADFDSILFVSPEYNYSVTGPLKTAIEWASYPENVVDDKTAAILTTGWDALGGARSQYHQRQIAVQLNLHLINTPELFINDYDDPPVFDKQGNLIREDVRAKLKQILLSLYSFTLRLRG